MEDWMEDVLPLRKDNLDRVKRQMNQMVDFQCRRDSVDIALMQGIAGLILLPDFRN